MTQSIAPLMSVWLLWLLFAATGLSQSKPEAPFEIEFPKDTFPVRVFPLQETIRYEDPLTTWKMKDGLTFDAKPQCNIYEEINFHRSSPLHKDSFNFVVKPEEMDKVDLERLRKTCFLAPKPLLKLLYYKSYKATPVWDNSLGKAPQDLTEIVHFDQEAIYFKRQQDIVAVKKEAIVEASRKEIEDQISKSIHSLDLDAKLAATPLQGRPVQEFNDYWIIEITNQMQMDSTPIAGKKPEHCFLYPKRFLTPLGASVVKDTHQAVKQDLNQAELNQEDIKKFLYCLQDSYGEPIFFSPDSGFVAFGKSPSDDTALYKEKTFHSSNPQMSSLSVDAQFEAYRMAYVAKGKDANAASKLALTRLLGLITPTSKWKIGNSYHYANPLGSIGDGIIFGTDSQEHFFVPATELDPITRKIAIAKVSSVRSNWAKEINLARVLATRMTQFGLVTLSAETTQVNDILHGEIPQQDKDLKSPATQFDSVNSYATTHNAFRLEGLQVARFLKSNENILKSGSNSKIIAAMNAKYPLPSEEEFTEEDLDGGEESEWKLLADEAHTYNFQGRLIGKNGKDFIFEQTVGNEFKSFLVDENMLDKDYKSRANQLLKTLKTKKPISEVYRHHGQYFRLMHSYPIKYSAPAIPAVVERLDDDGYRFRLIDGTRSSLSIGYGVEKEERLAFYKNQRTFADGRKDADIPNNPNFFVWTFLDCEPSVRAELIGESTECYLARNVYEEEFLISKYNITPATRIACERTTKKLGKLKQVPDEQVWNLPRIWCARNRIIGPAYATYYSDSSEMIYYRETGGSSGAVSIDELTVSDASAFTMAWKWRFQPEKFRKELLTAKDPVAFDKWIKDTSTPKNVITKTPDLKPELLKKLHDLVDRNKIVSWTTTEAFIPSGYDLTALNATASHALIANASDWQIADLSNGNAQFLIKPPFNPSNRPANHFGPWMGEDNTQAFWVHEGILYQSKLGNKEPTAALKNENRKIIAASLTPSFKHIVLAFNDNQVIQWSIATGEQTDRVASRNPEAPITNLQPCLDGQAIAYEKRGGVYQLTFLKNSDLPIYKGLSKESLDIKQADAGLRLHGSILSNLTPEWIGCSTTHAFASFTKEVRLVSRTPIGPTALKQESIAFPFPVTHFQSVEYGDQEVLQIIGRPADPVSRKADRYYVYFAATSGDWLYRQYQQINAILDERFRVSANGAAIAHFSRDRLQISRRPETPSISISNELTFIAEKLIAERDIGQLESILKTLDSAPFLNVGPYPGWLSNEFVINATSSLYKFQPQLLGDRELRAKRLAVKFRKQFPTSQFANVVLGYLYHKTAWTARGSGTADRVTEAGMKSFGLNINRARECVTPFLDKDATAATYALLIEVARAQGDMQLLQQVTKKLNDSQFSRNPAIHNGIAFTLLPRWHGKPGESEAYRDALCDNIGGIDGDILYAQLSTLMHVGAQRQGRISVASKVDTNRFMKGVLAYYEKSTDSSLMDEAIRHMGIERNKEAVEKLFQLRFDKSIGPGLDSIRRTKDMSIIEGGAME